MRASAAAFTPAAPGVPASEGEQPCAVWPARVRQRLYFRTFQPHDPRPPLPPASSQVEALKSEADEWKQTVERLRATTEKAMWRDDLDAFELVGGKGGVGEAAQRSGYLRCRRCAGVTQSYRERTCRLMCTPFTCFLLPPPSGCARLWSNTRRTRPAGTLTWRGSRPRRAPARRSSRPRWVAGAGGSALGWWCSAAELERCSSIALRRRGPAPLPSRLPALSRRQPRARARGTSGVMMMIARCPTLSWRVRGQECHVEKHARVFEDSWGEQGAAAHTSRPACLPLLRTCARALTTLVCLSISLRAPYR